MKNTIKAITLVTVFMFGTSLAMAEGIIIGDRGTPTTCAEKGGIIIGDRGGIIIGDRGFFGGVLDTVKSFFGGDVKETPCAEKGGIIIGDREGIIIGDRTGIIIGD